MKNGTKKTTTTVSKKPNYVKVGKKKEVGYDRWDGDSLGVRAIKDLKPIQRGKQ